MARCTPSTGQPIEGVLGWKHCAGVALIAAAASGFVVATVDGEIAAWAIDLPSEVRRSAWFDSMRAIGAYAAFWLLCVLAWARRRPRVLLVALLALVLCGAGVAALKCAFGRGRPDRDSELRPIPSRAVEDFEDLSFPSGDTAQAFALAFVAASYLPRRWRWSAFALASLPALQRVVAARHFLGDVLGGLALGALCAWLAVAILYRAGRTMRWRWRLPVRRELALIAGAGWGCLWTFDEGRIFAQYGAPLVALVVLAVKGPAVLRWVGGTRCGAVLTAHEARTRWRSARTLGLLLCAAIALPPLATDAPFDRAAGDWIEAHAFGSLFLARLGNALGWLLGAYFAGRVAERLAGPRAGLVAMLLAGAAFEFAWLARWSGFEMLATAGLWLALEGAVGLRFLPRRGDAARIAFGVAGLLAVCWVWTQARAPVELWTRSFVPTGASAVLSPWSAPFWLAVALMPWPLWFIFGRGRRSSPRTSKGERELIGSALLVLGGALLAGLPVPFAAMLAAAPVLVWLALRLAHASPRGLVVTGVLTLVLAMACVTLESPPHSRRNPRAGQPDSPRPAATANERTTALER